MKTAFIVLILISIGMAVFLICLPVQWSGYSYVFQALVWPGTKNESEWHTPPDTFTGLWKHYSYDGGIDVSVAAQVEVENGIYNGEFIYFGSSGKAERVVTYDNGIVVGSHNLTTWSFPK